MSKEDKEWKFALIENDSLWIGEAQFTIGKMGYPLLEATIAKTFKDAKALILQLVQLGITHLLLDANLTVGQYSGEEGLYLYNMIKEHAPEVKVIGFSDSPQSYVDIQMGKGNIRNLEQIIVNSEE